LWLDHTEEKLEKIPYIDPQRIRSEIIENISTVKSNMNNFYNNFKSSFDLWPKFNILNSDLAIEQWLL